MEIQILHTAEGAAKAQGLTVIIDVFRAFSTACYAVFNGAKRIIPVASVEDAFTLARKIPDSILLGERNEMKVEGFDFGNSPTHILYEDFTGKTIIQTTSAGTQGFSKALNAEELITGSFVNAGAIIQYIRERNPAQLSLVAMGYNATRPSQEDTFLAEYIESRLMDKPTDFSTIEQTLRTGDGARLLDPRNNAWSPATDFDLCLDLNRFDFILRLEQQEDEKALVPYFPSK